MKKTNSLISAALVLCATCAMTLPAHALEYSFGPPPAADFGKATSIEQVITADGGAMENMNQSKDVALIPPGFGSAASYLPESGTALTPSFASVQQVSTGTVNGSTVTITPPAVEIIPSTSISSAIAGFTQVTSGFYYSDGSLGTLKIPSIGLTVKVFEGTGSAPLLKGAGHFEGTSIWDGNCCIAGHNRGVRNDFGKLHTLKSGDTITFTTALGTRTYAVTSVTKVSVNDTSGLFATANNQLTLYTCVENQPAYRWCVIATETV